MNRVNKILLVEDDQTIALGIKVYLEKKQFIVSRVSTLEEAKLSLLNEKDIGIVLLDLNLPDGQGYELCRFIRKRSSLPIIFLTVCDEEEQVIKGLDLGADDYITKPFKLSILQSRIQAVLRRAQSSGEGVDGAYEGLSNSSSKTLSHNGLNKGWLQCGNVRLDEQKKFVYLNEVKIDLSAGEYRLLHILLSHKNYTLTRRQLLEKMWDENEQFVNDNTLTVTMKRLREKLGQPDFIKTIRGIGYLIEETQ